MSQRDEIEKALSEVTILECGSPRESNCGHRPVLTVDAAASVCERLMTQLRQSAENARSSAHGMLEKYNETIRLLDKAEQRAEDAERALVMATDAPACRCGMTRRNKP